jgi:adenylyl cyclase-associated protein
MSTFFTDNSVLDSATVQNYKRQVPLYHENPSPLTCVLYRLEAATSRLEDIASSTAGLEVPPNTNGAPSASAAVVPVPTPSPPVPAKEELPPMIVDFDTLIYGDVKAYHTLSTAKGIGGLLGEQVCSVQESPVSLAKTSPSRKPS